MLASKMLKSNAAKHYLYYQQPTIMTDNDLITYKTLLVPVDKNSA